MIRQWITTCRLVPGLGRRSIHASEEEEGGRGGGCWRAPLLPRPEEGSRKRGRWRDAASCSRPGEGQVGGRAGREKGIESRSSWTCRGAER